MGKVVKMRHGTETWAVNKLILCAETSIETEVADTTCDGEGENTVCTERNGAMSFQQ